MSDEQKIEGVPEGFSVVRLIPRPSDTAQGWYYEAIIERIPKPKQQMLVAEVAITAEEAKLIRISTVKILWSPMETRVVDSWRIEERDA